MNPQIKGIVLMLLKAIVAGALNIVLFALLVNPFNSAVKLDEVVSNTFVLNFFVGWMLFTAWFLGKTDEEWKKCAEAVFKNDFETFKLEAPKRIALSIRVLYLVISAMVVYSFYLFHIESKMVLASVQFGVGFFVVMAILVLWDLDDPTRGVVNVPDVPDEWLEKLK